jgi:hypothetical protein
MSANKSQGESAHKNQNSNGRQSVRPIAELEIKPHQRLPLLLGNFAAGTSPIGFTIETNADPLETLATQVVILNAVGGRKFVTYLTNSGKKTVTAKVWEL